MECKIIADSCCDLTHELEEKLGVTHIPLTMRLGDKEFSDDKNLDLEGFMTEMKACKEKVSSAAPAPHFFQNAIEKAKQSFVITLSEKLSGSYNSAIAGKELAEENGAASAHVIDSKSAAAGEALVAIKLWELMQNGMAENVIIQTINRFIDDMKTYFLLESYDNLQKNGRMSKVSGAIATILNIKLLMGSDGNGSIALVSKQRGINKAIDKIVSLIKESGRKIEGENLVISHCNNPDLAERLTDAIRRLYNFKEIFIIPMRGLSSMYADDKGIVLAF